jgi:hypothetical protein
LRERFKSVPVKEGKEVSSERVERTHKLKERELEERERDEEHDLFFSPLSRWRLFDD